MVKSIFLVFLSTFLMLGCQQQPLTDIRVMSIKESIITFSDNSTRTLPHYNDPNYTTFYFVRHCEKAKDGTNDPDLTPEGRARASKLGRLLEQAGLDEIVTTQYKRTLQTGDAVHKKMPDIPLVQVKADSLETWLTYVLTQHPGEQFLSVGHQNTVPQLLNILAGKLQYQNIPDNEFGRLYIAVTQGGSNTEILELQY